MHLQSSVSHLGWFKSIFSTNKFSAILAISFSLILSACGGGGNSVTENDLQDPTSDGVPPILTSVSILQSQERDASPDGVAKLGQSIKVDFTASEALMLPVVTINGVSASVEGKIGDWSASREMVEADVDGYVTFNISFTDISGVPGTDVSETTDGSRVQYCAEGCVAPVEDPLVGEWMLDGEGAAGVGPTAGSMEWWSTNADVVSERACWFDDLFAFSLDGTFQNIQGETTWVEAWQGGADSCAAPVSPHDGSNPATWAWDESAGTITINGKGAHLGLAKAVNGEELSSSGSAPDSITYTILTLTADGMNLTVTLETAPGVWWTFNLAKKPVSPFVGNWKLDGEGAAGVGPTAGSMEWWSTNADVVAERACWFDDVYAFGSDGSFTNIFGEDTWVEAWQGGSDSCAAPVAPHDGSAAATFSHDEEAGTLTITGKGAHLGLPKAVNGQELSSSGSAPDSITYQILTLTSDGMNLTVTLETAPGVWWTFNLAKVPPSPLAGNWKLDGAGSAGVGPTAGSMEWWSANADVVAERACWFDDRFVFGEDGSFQNVLGETTWIEAWQGGSDACGAPVAPHDGSASATFSYDEASATLTLTGKGAHLGLPKAVNGEELSSPSSAPDSITYQVLSLTSDGNYMSVTLETAPGVWWSFNLAKVPVSALAGTWSLDTGASPAAAGVGPTEGSMEWWSTGADVVAERACWFDDTYVFGDDGTFTNVHGEDTWVEAWQGGSDSCAAPVAPHDGSNPATFTYDESAGTFTINGKGAYVGLAKAVNGSELSSSESAPDSVTYNVLTATSDGKYLTLSIEAGAGVWWTFNLVKSAGGGTDPAPEPEPEPEPSIYAEWSAFDGAVKDGDNYSWVEGQDWAGFENTNTSLNPFSFPYGGTITFSANVGGGLTSTDLNFTFEANKYPNNNPQFTVGTTVDSESEMNYSIDVPAQGDQTFNSLLMKLGARVAEGQYVTVKNVLITANTSDPTEPTDPVEPTTELVTNGDFQNGITDWEGGAAVAENITSYFAVAETTSNNVYDVNLSQSMTLVPDSNYTVSFKAKSSIERTIIAGLGLYHDPWTNVGESVSLTTEWQTFTLEQTTTGFGDDDSRVLFDLGGDQGGQVWIDDVSVVTSDGTELVENGDFQSGITGWAGGAAVASNITSYFAVVETTSANVYDVNLSQTMTLVPDTDYTVSFKAKSSIERTILAGLGLYHDPWTNVAESVSLTGDWQSFTMTQTTTGFGDDQSRILFDMGGDQGGQVWIDDVSVLGPGSSDTETEIKIEAESFTNTVDVGLENGDTTVGFFDGGEVLEYSFTVETAGNYLAKYHVASNDGKDPGLNIKIDGSLADIVTVPATGGWGNFQTIEGRVIAMSAGTYALSVESVDGGVNVDWYSFTLTDAAPSEPPPSESELGTGMDNVLNVDEVIDFNSATADYALVDFGGNTSTVVADPTDATNSVVSVIKGTETWSGTTVARGKVVYPITEAAPGMSIRVWSPEAGITVKLKLEESGNSDNSVETDAVTTKAQEWETLVFDFSKPSAGTPAMNSDHVYDTLSVFLNFGSAGTSETYYFDDIKYIGVVPPSVAASDLEGSWKLAPIAGAFAVGPNSSDLSWYSNSADDVTTRACLFDDLFVFGADGAFSQDMGTETWLEGWQGVSADGCGTPVSPHDGSATDYTYSVTNNMGVGYSTVTVSGIGAHLGLAKVHNNGELSSPEGANDVSSITYNITEFAADGESMTVQIQYSGQQTWQFKFVKYEAPTPTTEGLISITKVIETNASSSNGFLKSVELYVTGTVDFSTANVVMNYMQNGEPWSERQIDLSLLGSQTDTYIYLVRDLAVMQGEFPSTTFTDVTTGSGNTLIVDMSTNGDDGYQVVIDGSVASQFGDTETDGTGTAWEHLDSFAERIQGTAEDGAFNIDHWSVQAVNYLDDYGTFNGAAALETVITLGNWKAASSSSPTSPYPEATQDPTGNGPDGTLGTDDDVTIKDLYTVTDSVVGELTFVRPPLNGEAPEATWGSATGRDLNRVGTNRYFRKFQWQAASDWCVSIDARLATAAEVAEHIRNGADTGIVGPGSSGYWESDLHWPQQSSHYWVADLAGDDPGDGSRHRAFITYNTSNGNSVHQVQGRANTNNFWPLCVME